MNASRSVMNGVVIIDDDEVNNLICEKLISRLGVCNTLRSFKKSTEAIEYLREVCSDSTPGCPDLIILDNDMPVLNGCEFLKEFKKIHTGKPDKVIILVLSVELSKEERADFIKLGVTDFNHKPLSEQCINDIIQKYWSE